MGKLKNCASPSTSTFACFSREPYLQTPRTREMSEYRYLDQFSVKWEVLLVYGIGLTLIALILLLISE